MENFYETYFKFFFASIQKFLKVTIPSLPLTSISKLTPVLYQLKV